MDTLDRAKRALVIANRILAMENVVDAYGHISIRHPLDPGRYLLARSLSPELVTLDISLPDENGLQVLEKLRKVDPAARVIVVTGNDQKAVEAAALKLRALGVLHKPFDEAELAAMLEKAAKR